MEKQQELTKVVSLLTRRQSNEKHSEAAKEQDKQTDENPSFLDEIRRNADNHERLRQERLKANQNVLKSYRIKN